FKVLGLPVVLLVSLAMVLLSSGVAYAADGDLDTSFSGDGKVSTDYIGTHDEARAVAVQPDGRIVVVGTTLISGTNYNFAVARYHGDGAPDTTFSGDGKLTTDFYGGDDGAYGVAIQPDGKIVVVGAYSLTNPSSTWYEFAFARYNPNGSLDSTFSGDGKMGIAFSHGGAVAYGVTIQPDGKIVAVGYAKQGTNYNFALARLNADGTYDGSIGQYGERTTDIFGGHDEARAVSMHAGRILVAGAAQVSGANYDFALVRYNLNGSLDTAFGGDGKVNTDFLGGDDGAYSMAVQADGKIVAAGGFGTLSTGYDFGLVRYLANGDLDAGFGSGGLANFTFLGGTAEEIANGIALQADGKIVVAGYAPGVGRDFALARLHPNGSLDTSFSGDGKLTTNFAGADDAAGGVAVQPDGRIVAAGYAYMGATGSDLAVARYLSGGAPVPTATPVPQATATPIPQATPTSQVTPTACPIQFPDVPPGSTFYDYVRCLACRGIVSGYPDGNFGPGNNVTRGQLSKIVSNSAGYTENHTGQTFEDVPVGSTFHQFIQRLSSRGYISGYACGGAGEPCVPPDNRPYFRPNNPVTRGQTAKIVASAAGLPAPPAGVWTFQDVPQGSTFWEWVESLSSAGAISGYACGGAGEPCFPPENRYYFRPGNNVTRGQSAKIVAYTFFPGCSTPLKMK
ncbi:MAG TPA: S-layer homology domain-containing protein, partial [Chloroflexia bacterium]|nr:S-layer homology domain-containing protein [Chloroflexia bacterium]